MTPEALKELVKKYKGYPHCLRLNDKLYAHFMGFDRIQNLEPFTGLKCLYLEKNAIEKIEGISHLQELSSLYLQENCLLTLEGLPSLQNLYTLNVSHNFIQVVEGLKGLGNLNTLIIHHNDIKETKCLQGLLECPSLSVLDISQNKLQNEDALDVLRGMPALKVLYLKGNPFVRKMRNYRKRVISQFPLLTYLDDRPIFPKERLLAEAWAKGGKEAEKAERERQRKEEHDKAKKRNQEFYEMFIKRNGLSDSKSPKSNVKTTTNPDPNSNTDRLNQICNAVEEKGDCRLGERKDDDGNMEIKRDEKNKDRGGIIDVSKELEDVE
uniref:Dynein assembly factor 1, axonemal homolog n=1 Tax=Amorphochlora amoebiformis TaxID=1561963 RepID=A0A7S0DLN6_9EUKA